jgi:uncharacterized coiled-coil DUF342 family protein
MFWRILWLSLLGELLLRFWIQPKQWQAGRGGQKGMLTDLEEKRGRLRQEPRAIGDRSSQFNAEASKWAERRNDLNRSTEELIERAKSFKKLRDESNKNVAQSKKKRDECNENIKQLYVKMEDIQKKRDPNGEHSIRELRREIDHLEFRQQTEVLSPEKERQLVEKISALRAEFKGRKEQLEKSEDMKKLLDQAQVLRDQASTYHNQVTRFAQLAQEYHDQMICSFKEADQTRAEADAAQKEFLKAQ